MIVNYVFSVTPKSKIGSLKGSTTSKMSLDAAATVYPLGKSLIQRDLKLIPLIHPSIGRD